MEFAVEIPETAAMVGQQVRVTLPSPWRHRAYLPPRNKYRSHTNAIFPLDTLEFTYVCMLRAELHD